MRRVTPELLRTADEAFDASRTGVVRTPGRMNAPMARGRARLMISSGDPARTCPGQRSAEVLWQVVTVLLAVMPLAMALAHRSSPLLISAAAAVALVATLVEGQGLHAYARAKAGLGTPLGLSALVFLTWAAASLTWSALPKASLYALGEFVLPVAAAFVLALSYPQRAPRHAGPLLAAAVIAAGLVVLYQLVTDLGLRQDFGLRAQRFVFNRPVMTLLLLAPALLSLLLAAERRWVAGTAALLIAAAILKSESGAAKFGLVSALATFVLAWARPALAVRLLAIAALATLVLAPVFGDVAARLLPPRTYEVLAKAHARDRVEIWQSFDAAIRQQPLLGAGFGVSTRLDETPVAARVAPEFRRLLAVGHPHNAPIQIWVELGLIGALLAGAVIILAARGLAHLPAAMAAPRLALGAAILAISLVGHGAWQGWWPAAIGAALVWFRIANRQDAERGR